MFAVARGIEWLGRRVRQGRVIYLAAEGAGGVRKRLRAYASENGIDLNDVPLSIIDAPANFLAKDEKSIGEVVINGGSAALIIIDTLAQVTPGGDENSSSDMGNVIAACKYLHKLTGAFVLLVHHTGKDATRGARGHSSLMAAMDSAIEIVKDGNLRRVMLSKMKDGRDGLLATFKLRPVIVGYDEYGDEETSCIVDYIDAPGGNGRSKHKSKYKNAVLAAYDSYNDLDLPTKESIVDAALSHLPDGIGEGKRDSRREQLQRAFDGLVANGEIEHVAVDCR